VRRRFAIVIWHAGRMRIWIVFPRLGVLILTGLLVFLTACGAPKQPSIEDLTHREDLSQVRMTTLRGTRDGATLDTEATFSGRSMLFTVRMRFAIGTPTTLMSGTWLRESSSIGVARGNVFARSVSFLGGQGGSPSIGGSFDLLDADGAREYRVAIPILELRDRLRPQGPQP
jgi:hypothetical protein